MEFLCNVSSSSNNDVCRWDWTNSIISMCFMYIILLILVYFKCTENPRSRKTNQRLNCSSLRATIYILLFFLFLIELADAILSKSPIPVYSVPISSMSYLIATIFLDNLLDRSLRCRRLLPFLPIMWICIAGGRLVTYFVVSNPSWDHLRTSSAVGITVMSLLVALSLFYDYRKVAGSNESGEKEDEVGFVSYEHDTAHLYSRITFCWVTKLLKIGYEKPLELNDLGYLPEEHSVKKQFADFLSIYVAEKNKSNLSIGLLWKCYWKFMWKEFSIGGVLKLLSDVSGLVGPLGISFIIDYVTKQRSKVEDNYGAIRYPTYLDLRDNGFTMSAVVFMSALAQSVFSQASTNVVTVRAIHLKSALQALVYNKSLQLRSYSVKADTDENKDGAVTAGDTGNISNLMSEDVFNIMSFFWLGHYTWSIPLKIFIIIYLLNIKLGISAVLGALITIMTLTPLQYYIGKKMSKNTSKISDISDERLQLVNELLHGIRLLKLLGWEEYYLKKINKVRDNEVKLLNKDSRYWAVMTFFTHASSILITLITFSVHNWIAEAKLEPREVFAGLALFNQLTVPLFIFPVTVPVVIGAWVSTRRLRDFLSQPEASSTVPQKIKLRPTSDSSKPSTSSSITRTYMNVIPEVVIPKLYTDNPTGKKSTDNVFGLGNIDEKVEEEEETMIDDLGEVEDASKKPENILSDNSEAAVKIEDGVFTWTPEASLTCLRIKKVSIPKGKITMIVGKIGSGKTSLLSALLGEMYSTSGTVTWARNTIVAYAAQTPWLLNTSIRDNILFGQTYRPRRYQKVITACALQVDIDILPAKDMTEVGEQGINLSGGQKQRIAVARALYSRANFVILDDPLCSLDYTIALHVFEEGIKRLVHRCKRTVVVVTHQLQLIAHADQIIAMENGRVRIQGQLGDIELRDSELIKHWTSEMSSGSAAGGGFHGKTAKERWHLLKMVTKVGMEVKESSLMWKSRQELLRASTFKRLSTFSGWRYMTHDLPLPTDECEDELIDAGSRWRRFNRTHKPVSRATSLQTAGHCRMGLLNVVRQYSSPLVSKHSDADRYKSCSYDCDTSNSYLMRQLMTNSHPEKRPVKRLLSTESGFSDDNSEVDGDEWEQPKHDDTVRTYDDRECGTIPKHVYLTYLMTCGTTASLVYLFVTLVWQVIRVATDFWLSVWAESSHQDNKSTYWYVSVYSILSVSSVIFSLMSHGVGQAAGAGARKKIHDSMVSRIVQCPLKFFETTPSGIILSRFSTDTSVIDKKIATSIQRLVQFLFLCCSAVIVNAAVTPWFILAVVPMCLVYYVVQLFYRSSSRELQRLDSVTRSPIFSHCTQTLAGLTTIRAYGYQDRFISSLFTKIDTNTNAFLIMNSGNRWLGIALDSLGGVIVFSAMLTSLISSSLYPNIITPSMIGLAINYTLLVPIYLNWVVKFLADCEVYMGAVERCKHYTLLDIEQTSHHGADIPVNWPDKGDIEFRGVSLKYYTNDSVIHKLNLRIPYGQKIGICGRSGCGKSTLALSLFNTVDICEGNITIDHINITHIPHHLLRSKISIVPQDVLMLHGTVRQNMDPLHQFTDEQVWSALEAAELDSFIKTHFNGLDGEIEGGGANLSSGQKQLFCLARAVLRDTRYLIMDEATSNLDPSSEKCLMSSALRAFDGRTVIIIAHRLNTLVDCDRIVVFEKGKLVEDGTPGDLINKPCGFFSAMLRTTDEDIYQTIQ